MLESWDEGGYSVADAGGPKGELLIGGPTVATGYFSNDQPESKDFFTDQDGVHWFRTGDICSVKEKVSSHIIIYEYVLPLLAKKVALPERRMYFIPPASHSEPTTSCKIFDFDNP